MSWIKYYTIFTDKNEFYNILPDQYIILLLALIKAF